MHPSEDAKLKSMVRLDVDVSPVMDKLASLKAEIEEIACRLDTLEARASALKR